MSGTETEKNATLAEHAQKHLSLFDKVMFRYTHTMQQFVKMLKKDKDPLDPKQAIYPHLLHQMSKELYEGALDYIRSTRTLVRAYDKYSKVKKFKTAYQDRMDYLELMQEELQNVSHELDNALKEDVAYHDGLDKGKEKLSGLYMQLDLARKHMSEATQNSEQKAACEPSRPSTSLCQIA